LERGDHDRSVLSALVGSPLRVVVVDDHVLFARGLELLLGPATDGRVVVVATASNAVDGESAVREHRPGLAVVDLALPGPSGFELIKSLRLRYPDVTVVALSGTDEAAEALRALDAGAAGFLPKTSEPDDLLHPFLALAEGWSVLPPNLLRLLLSHGSRFVAVVERLSPDQRELLCLVASGMDTSELAAQLAVSERTAKRLVAALLAEIGVSNRIQAAALAGVAGLVDDLVTPPPD